MDTKKTGIICLNIEQVREKEWEGWSGHTLNPSPLVPPTLQPQQKVCSRLSLQWLQITMWG